MRKLNTLILCMMFIFSIGLVSAGIWGDGYIDRIYDEINDSSINGSLWSISGTGSSGETGDYLYVTSPSSSSSGTKTISSNSLVTPGEINNVSLRVFVAGYDEDSGGNPGQYFSGTLSIFGNTLITSQRDGDSGTGTVSDDSIWTIVKNKSAGSNKFDVYNDGVFSSQITASNNIISISAHREESTSEAGYGEARIYYVYYYGTDGNSYVVLNSPSDDSSVTTNLVTFDTLSNSTNGLLLANISLYTNETGSWGLRNTTNVSETNVSDISSYNLDNTLTLKTTFNVVGFVNRTLVYSRDSGQAHTVTRIVQYKYYDSSESNITSVSAGGINEVNWTLSINPNPSKLVEQVNIWANATTYNPSYPPTLLNETVFTNPTIKNHNFTNTYSSGDTILWNVLACDSEGDCGFANSNFTFLIDSTPPQPIIIYPSNVINILSNGQSVDLNISVSDSNLDSCWYEYNGANTTIGSCANTTFNYISGVNNITLWANDTAGNENSTTTSWTALISLTQEYHNTTTAETASEVFTTNISSNSSLTKAYLNYNGTYYAMSQSGTNWTTTIDIPLNKVQNNTYNYIYTYAGTNYSSENYYQQVNSTIFNLCNATYTTPFLNLTFKDEEDSSVLNASIPSSTWTYYLGSGLVNKTYTFTNTSVNYNYTFCATPTDRILNVDPYVQYKQDPSYPQRVWDSGVQQYNSSMTTQELFLLNSADGIYVTFQVINLAEQSLEGVVVNATRDISGTEVLISSGTTGSAGTITFLLNPDFTHTFNFYLEGYSSLTTSLAPTSSSYTITLGGESSSEDNYLQGISFLTSPSRTFLDKNTVHNFSLSISSIYWDLDEWGFNLSYSNGTLIGSNSSTIGTGGILYLFDVNVSDSESIVMQGYYILNETTYLFNLPRIWKIQETDGTEFSIFNFFNRVNTYTEAEFFGINNFGKLLISAIILISTAGIMTSRYGINSEATITGIIFSIVFLLEVGLEFIPPITIPATGITLPRGILTAVTFIVATALLIREESR